jgi:hypothetical protein
MVGNLGLFSGRGETPHRRYGGLTFEPASAMCVLMGTLGQQIR